MKQCKILFFSGFIGQKEKYPSVHISKRVLQLCLPLNKLKILDFFNSDIACKLLILGFFSIQTKRFSLWKLIGTYPCYNLDYFSYYFQLPSTFVISNFSSLWCIMFIKSKMGTLFSPMNLTNKVFKQKLFSIVI